MDQFLIYSRSNKKSVLLLTYREAPLQRGAFLVSKTRNYFRILPTFIGLNL